MDDSQAQSIILKAVDQLQYHFNINDLKMIDYLQHCGMNLGERLKNVLKHNRLETLVIFERELESKSIITTFKASDRMSDNRFRVLVEKIMNCENAEDKISIIRKNFHSLYDYIDMLNADCLLNDEYEVLFKSFGDIELAVLMKIVFYEELRNDSTFLSSFHMVDKDRENKWQIYFIEFIQNIDIDRKNAIEKYVSDIDYEEISFY